jgi:hypothetical protein
LRSFVHAVSVICCSDCVCVCTCALQVALQNGAGRTELRERRVPLARPAPVVVTQVHGRPSRARIAPQRAAFVRCAQLSGFFLKQRTRIKGSINSVSSVPLLLSCSLCVASSIGSSFFPSVCVSCFIRCFIPICGLPSCGLFVYRLPFEFKKIVFGVLLPRCHCILCSGLREERLRHCGWLAS